MSLEIEFVEDVKGIGATTLQFFAGAMQKVTLKNKAGRDFQIAFRACHPFVFNQNKIAIPAGQTLRLGLGRECHFTFDIDSNLRPPSRIAIISILQPIGGGDDACERERLDQPAAPPVFVISGNQKQLDLNPKNVLTELGNEVIFQNDSHYDAVVEFQPVSPFSGQTYFEVSEKEPLELILEDRVVFPFVIRLKNDQKVQDSAQLAALI